MQQEMQGSTSQTDQAGHAEAIEAILRLGQRQRLIEAEVSDLRLMFDRLMNVARDHEREEILAMLGGLDLIIDERGSASLDCRRGAVWMRSIIQNKIVERSSK